MVDFKIRSLYPQDGSERCGVEKNLFPCQESNPSPYNHCAVPAVLLRGAILNLNVEVKFWNSRRNMLRYLATYVPQNNGNSFKYYEYRYLRVIICRLSYIIRKQYQEKIVILRWHNWSDFKNLLSLCFPTKSPNCRNINRSM